MGLRDGQNSNLKRSIWSHHCFFSLQPSPFLKVKPIEGHRWHPVEKRWSFPNSPYPPHRWGREKEGVKKLESRLSSKFNASSKTTEIYTHVSTKNLGEIRSPLDNLDWERGEIDKI